MNDLVKVGSAVPAIRGRDPFSSFANTFAPKFILGTLLKFSKGDWYAGENLTPLKIGSPFTAIMDELTCGWILWRDGKPEQQVMARVNDGETPPRRAELGYLDKESWEYDQQGKPKDPWTFTIYLPLVDPRGEVYTFTTSSHSGVKAIGELSRRYANHRKVKPNEYPNVLLNLSSYKHQTYGIMKTPVFEPGGYVEKATVAEALERAGVSVQSPEVETKAATEELDDAIPF